uniref:Uncharacterized protein n=1 Tax=Chromera velia CCMP2878 TaxID=1169474 RepID=A0A0G4F5S6_9ALVE|eukprot:Cvel_2759.t1-p1 / transcript=Cvel_2759.t1 / gene=Cvel_2759 / organism=Chromera_velia_CCMP2878 / gene_product=hypothetical protein / transcript_product=hypothetical protein / location=Cvel_scaffold111:6843-9506(+) / protein_length=615 / sequence_SO=supercontig / SO=protein_coding / is_pseudo=false
MALLLDIPQAFEASDLRDAFRHAVDSQTFHHFHFCRRKMPDKAHCCALALFPSREGLSAFCKSYEGSEWHELCALPRGRNRSALRGRGGDLLRCRVLAIVEKSTSPPRGQPKEKKGKEKTKAKAAGREKETETVSSQTPERRGELCIEEALLYLGEKNLSSLPELLQPSGLPRGNVGTSEGTVKESIRRGLIPPRAIRALGFDISSVLAKTRVERSEIPPPPSLIPQVSERSSDRPSLLLMSKNKERGDQQAASSLCKDALSAGVEASSCHPGDVRRRQQRSDSGGRILSIPFRLEDHKPKDRGTSEDSSEEGGERGDGKEENCRKGKSTQKVSMDDTVQGNGFHVSASASAPVGSSSSCGSSRGFLRRLPVTRGGKFFPLPHPHAKLRGQQSDTDPPPIPPPSVLKKGGSVGPPAVQSGVSSAPSASAVKGAQRKKRGATSFESECAEREKQVHLSAEEKDEDDEGDCMGGIAPSSLPGEAFSLREAERRRKALEDQAALRAFQERERGGAGNPQTDANARPLNKRGGREGGGGGGVALPVKRWKEALLKRDASLRGMDRRARETAETHFERVAAKRRRMQMADDDEAEGRSVSVSFPPPTVKVSHDDFDLHIL